MPRDGKPTQLNGNIVIIYAILKIVAASAAEVELAALFVNTKEARVIHLILSELGHPQPPTPIHIDNTTAVGIVNRTIKWQRSRSTEMRYFCLQIKLRKYTSHFTTILERNSWQTVLPKHIQDQYSTHTCKTILYTHGKLSNRVSTRISA